MHKSQQRLHILSSDFINEFVRFLVRKFQTINRCVSFFVGYTLQMTLSKQKNIGRIRVKKVNRT